jgi:hypothetical protein
MGTRRRGVSSAGCLLKRHHDKIPEIPSPTATIELLVVAFDHSKVVVAVVVVVVLKNLGPRAGFG